MGSTVFQKLYGIGDALSGKFMRVIGGRRDDGTAQAIRVNALGEQLVIPGRSVTSAFGRARSTLPHEEFVVSQVLDNAPLIMDTSLATGGTATWDSNISSTNMTVTTSSGSSVVRQSKLYAPYRPGQTQLIYLTGIIGAQKTNVRSRIGYFDTVNGLYFQMDGTTGGPDLGLSVVVRTNTSGSVVNNVVTQANWNLDKLDGTGSSGITLDPSKMLAFVIDFAWLGAGGARFGFLFNDRIVYCHRYDAANVFAVPFIGEPNLPLRWEITNTGATASSTTMLQTCGAVFSEGAGAPGGIVVSAGTGVAGRSISGAVPIVSVRLRASAIRGFLVPIGFDSITTSNASYITHVVVGGTLTGASFNPTTGPSTEFDIAASAITGGTVIATTFAAAAGSRASAALVSGDIKLGASIAGTADILSLVITPTTGSMTTLGSLTWREVY